MAHFFKKKIGTNLCPSPSNCSDSPNSEKSESGTEIGVRAQRLDELTYSHRQDTGKG